MDEVRIALIVCVASGRPFHHVCLRAPRALDHSTTKLFFRLTRSEDGENDDRLRKFLRTMGLKDADVPLLRFWTSGLSRQYRTLLLQQH